MVLHYLPPRAGRILLPALGLVMAATLALALPAYADSWTGTASMSVPRASAIIVSGAGKALVAGGFTRPGSAPTTSAQIYNFVTGQWSAAGSMNDARALAAGVILNSNTVLVAGGATPNGGEASNTAELYNVQTNTWALTGSMQTARGEEGMITLPNGQVLVAGGYNSSGSLATAEIYNPSSGTWFSVADMNVARAAPVLMPVTVNHTFEVLAIGGNDIAHNTALASAELYNPTRGTWTLTGSMSSPRVSFIAAKLSNGEILVAGGTTSFGPSGQILNAAEEYNPATGTWTTVAAMNVARESAASATIKGGNVLVAGGQNSSGILSSSEYFNPSSGTWTMAAPMLAEQRDAMMAYDPGTNTALLAGGELYTKCQTVAELYHP
jgi:N-acetylneuraminic acid mutarotase